MHCQLFQFFAGNCELKFVPANTSGKVITRANGQHPKSNFLKINFVVDGQINNPFNCAVAPAHQNVHMVLLLGKLVEVGKAMLSLVPGVQVNDIEVSAAHNDLPIDPPDQLLAMPAATVTIDQNKSMHLLILFYFLFVGHVDELGCGRTVHELLVLL